MGTSSVVYPAANFAPLLAARGIPVAEFNLEETPVNGDFRWVKRLKLNMHSKNTHAFLQVKKNVKKTFHC